MEKRKNEEVKVLKIWFKEWLNKNQEFKKAIDSDFIKLSKIAKSDDVYMIFHTSTKPSEKNEGSMTINSQVFVTDKNSVCDISWLMCLVGLRGLKFQNLNEYPNEIIEIISNFVYSVDFNDAENDKWKELLLNR